MDWVDRRQIYKCLYGILQLLQGSHLDNFSLKTLKLGWVAFHSLTFWLKCLDFQSNQYKKLAPVLSRFCNGLWAITSSDCLWFLCRFKRLRVFLLPLNGMLVFRIVFPGMKFDGTHFFTWVERGTVKVVSYPIT